MHGTERANRAIQASDLILGLGLRFDDRVTGHVPGFAPRAAIVHFDISPAAIGRTVTPTVRVVGDLARTLPAFLGGVSPASRPEWWADISGWPREAEPADDALPDGAGPLTGRTAARMLGRWIGERKAVLATDVGQHQMWLAQELRDADPRTHLTSGGLGTMGFALPAAIGAQVGCPDREVWVVAGDGGLQMSTPELATVKQENLPIRIVVFDNGTLGMVRQWQETVYGQRYVASAITSPDWVALARAYGIPARTASTAAELSDGLERLARQPGPALLDLRVPSNENVVPMIPPGATLSDMIVAPREGVLT
jgi:acetolactate synthase-1/2/3 large subunit